MAKQVNKVIFGGQTIMDVSDATADASNILKGKTAYVADGTKVTGTLNMIANAQFYNNKNIYFKLVGAPSVGASGLLYNGNQGVLLLLKLDDNPNVVVVSGNHQFTITKTEGTFILSDTNGTLWGTSVIVASADDIVKLQ